MDTRRKAIGTKLQVTYMESPWAFMEMMRELTAQADKIGWKPDELDVMIEVKISSRKQQPQLIIAAPGLPRGS